MKARLKKKLRETRWKRDGNARLKYILKKRTLINIHVVNAQSLMKQIFHLHREFPCDDSLVELRKWMTDNQKTLYAVFERET